LAVVSTVAPPILAVDMDVPDALGVAPGDIDPLVAALPQAVPTSATAASPVGTHHLLLRISCASPFHRKLPPLLATYRAAASFTGGCEYVHELI
jgi:hypothetical protein